MIFKPYPLSAALPTAELEEDKKNCQKFGPCGVGKKAIYLNSFLLDRRYYIPFASVQRVYKRLAMSKGGFTGKGLFATLPYLVVEYDNGKEKQCNFKYEEQVDQLLTTLEKEHLGIKLVSAAAEKRLADQSGAFLVTVLRIVFARKRTASVWSIKKTLTSAFSKSPLAKCRHCFMDCVQAGLASGLGLVGCWHRMSFLL